MIVSGPAVRQIARSREGDALTCGELHPLLPLMLEDRRLSLLQLAEYWLRIPLLGAWIVITGVMAMSELHRLGGVLGEPSVELLKMA